MRYSKVRKHKRKTLRGRTGVKTHKRKVKRRARKVEDPGVYEGEGRKKLLESEGITGPEEAFMRGYDPDPGDTVINVNIDKVDKFEQDFDTVKKEDIALEKKGKKRSFW